MLLRENKHYLKRLINGQTLETGQYFKNADTVDEVLDNLKKACRQELEEKYKNSEKGKFFKYLQNGIEDAKNILYSGLSIEDVWKNLEQVFGQAQIEVRVPKSFTQISK
jgi:wobble nucleotide-excising tRNase